MWEARAPIVADVSAGSSAGPSSSAIGQPWRSASIASATRRAAKPPSAAQSENSVISGTWSEHCTQSRVASTTRWFRTCGAS